MSGGFVAGVCLALMIDESASVPADVQQRLFEAHAQALLQSRVERVVETEGLVLGVWAFAGEGRVVVGPTLLRSAEDLRRVARVVEGAYVGPQLWTGTGGALEDVWAAMQGQACDRVVVDVVTDGKPHDWVVLRRVRAKMEEAGWTVNGLVVETELGVVPEEGLGAWARQELATSDGFVMEARTWQEWVASVGRKLVFEIGYLRYE